MLQVGSVARKQRPNPPFCYSRVTCVTLVFQNGDKSETGTFHVESFCPEIVLGSVISAMKPINTSHSSRFQLRLAVVLMALLCSIGIIGAQESTVGSGIVSGNVLDVDYGGTVYDANVTLVELGKSTKSNMDGRFFMAGIPDGQYTLVVSADYYKTARVTEIQVTSGEVVKLDVPMYGDSSDTVELATFEVKATVLENSDVGLLNQRQKAAAISDAIGSESFSRLGIGDAADALSKVTGVSIAEGKYMVVRGLSDRYNNTTLNGSTVPSADPDKRAVQLDQFPAGIIESVATTKSFTPDKSGSFTGGSVNVVTKSVPQTGFMNIGIGFSYNDQTTGKDYLTTSGGGDDWLGKDDGTRAIPTLALDENSIPLPDSSGFTEQDKLNLVEISKSFSSEIAPSNQSAPLSHSFSVAMGNRYYLSNESADKMVFGFIASLNYKRKYSSYDDGSVQRHQAGRNSISRDIDFNEVSGTDSSQLGGVLNLALQVDGSNEIGIKSMYNQSGSETAILRSGEFELAGSDFFQARSIQYVERNLNNYQLYGKHRIEPLGGLQASWEFSTSKSIQDEPDYRLFYDATPSIGRPTFQGNFPSPRRYWRFMEETNDEIKADFTLPLDGNARDLKFGFVSSDTHRDFNERLFSYRGSSGIPYDGDPSAFLSDAELSLRDDGSLGRYIVESKGAVPIYFGDQEIDAAYMMADFELSEKWRVIAGARFEDASIVLQSFNVRGQPNTNDGALDDQDWLPALHLVRSISEKQNLRFSATSTLARPNFRELSPFGSFDNAGGEVFIGNPNLVNSEIDNYDLRYEWFMDGGQLFAASAFYKDLKNPIERAILEGQLTYVNVPEASIYGLELEFRKDLPVLSSEYSRFSVGSNLSLTESEVDRDAQDLLLKSFRNPDVSPTRELQGQSSVIGNADLHWEHYRIGTSLSLVYNYTGSKLYSVSEGQLGDIMEDPTSDLDFIYSQKLKNGYSVKFSVTNLLDEDKRRYLDDVAGELLWHQYGRGRSVSISVNKSFD